MEYLNPEVLPRYLESSFRTFLPGESHVERFSDYDVLLFLLSGTLIFGEDGIRQELTAGDWYIQRCRRHQQGLSPSLSPHYFYIHFQGDFSSKEGLPLQGTFSPEVFRHAFEQLDFSEKNQRSLLERTRWFYELLSLMQDGQRKTICPTVSEMQAYIASHFAEALTVQELAERFSYSPDYVIRLFKRYLGVTPHQYIAQIRLHQAQHMLTTTNRPLPLIAAQTGFSDSTVLFRTFVRETGLSPTAWKKSIENTSKSSISNKL